MLSGFELKTQGSKRASCYAMAGLCHSWYSGGFSHQWTWVQMQSSEIVSNIFSRFTNCQKKIQKIGMKKRPEVAHFNITFLSMSLTLFGFFHFFSFDILSVAHFFAKRRRRHSNAEVELKVTFLWRRRHRDRFVRFYISLYASIVP